MDIYFKGIVLWDGGVSVGQDAIIWYFHRNSWKIIRKRVWNLQSWNYGNIWMGCIFGPKASTQSIYYKKSHNVEIERNICWLLNFYSSIMDHSCEPNCGVSFSGNRITVTALQNIKSIDDVKISYLDSSLPTETRQEKLFEDYFFHCQCQKCAHTNNGHKRNKGKRWQNLPE